MKPPVRWGILGVGAVCEVKSGPAFQKAQDSRLVAVMRRDAARAEDYARRHGVPRWYADADSLIADPEVDAVYIATPPGAHLELALRVCASGKPAYVEKPMARNAAECDRMVAAFHAARVPLFVAYYRRAQSRFLKVEQVLRSGQLGIVTGINVRYARPVTVREQSGALPWRLRAEHSGGGLFMDIASHTLDLLDHLFGPLSEIAGDAANLASDCPVEDHVVLRFRTSSGALGVGQWNFASAVPADRLIISGTRAELELSVFGSEPISLRSASSLEQFDAPPPEHVQQPLIQSIVNELLGRGTCPSTGVSAARTSRVLDRALERYYGHRNDDVFDVPSAWPGRRSHGSETSG